MSGVRLAVISDVHGNRWALEAVLQDIARRAVRNIVNLGDSFYGPLDPAGTARILLPLGLPTVRGNEDRIIAQSPGESDDSPTLDYVRTQLSPEHRRWLTTLELTIVAFGDFRLCHGSLDHDDEYLLREVTEADVLPRKPAELVNRLGSWKEAVLLCGHDHVPRTVRLPDGRLVVNPGSVGLPAYADDLPFPHAMQTGTPHARYSIVSGDRPNWEVEVVTVPYDWESAARAAERHGRPDWAGWLRTGQAKTPGQASRPGR